MEFTIPTTTIKRVLNEDSYEFVTTHEDRFDEEIRNMEAQTEWIHDLETKDLIEVYSKGESNCANIKDIKINNESQEGKNSYACRRKTNVNVYI